MAVSSLLIGLWLLGALAVWFFIFPFLKSVCSGPIKNLKLRRIVVSALIGVPLGLFFAEKFGPKSAASTAAASTAAFGALPPSMPMQAPTAPYPSPGTPSFALPMPTPAPTFAPAPASQSQFIVVPQQTYDAEAYARAALAALS